jgi:hypothetical protein
VELITTLRLRELLFDVKDKRPDVCFRFRLTGQLWQPNFSRLVKIIEKGTVLHDETIDEFVFIADLSDIMQFEIDQRYREFQPHFHYDVKSVAAAW